MERIGFRPTGIGARIETPKLNLGEGLKRANFTPLRGGLLNRGIEIQRQRRGHITLGDHINRLERIQRNWTPEWERSMRARERAAQARYQQRMMNETISYLRKKHKKKDDLALAAVRSTIRQIQQDNQPRR